MTQPDWRRFLEKRVRRIYPGFIVAVAIGAFVVVPIFSTIEPVSSTLSFMPEFFGKTLRLLQATPGQAFQGNPAPGTVNGSLWSISYEFWCYIGIIIFGTLGIFRWPSLLASGVVASIFISFAFVWFRFNPSGSWLGVILGYPPFWARLLPYFGVGMAFYALRERIPLTTKGAAFSIIIFVLASLIPYSLIFVLPVAAAYMIFWFAFVPFVPLHRFSRYGDFSYGIYLYSFPVLQIVVYLYDGQMNPLLLFAIGWPLSVAAGAMSWHLVERHWLRSGSPTERSRFIRASR